MTSSQCSVNRPPRGSWIVPCRLLVCERRYRTGISSSVFIPRLQPLCCVSPRRLTLCVSLASSILNPWQFLSCLFALPPDKAHDLLSQPQILWAQSDFSFLVFLLTSVWPSAALSDHLPVGESDLLSSRVGQTEAPARPQRDPSRATRAGRLWSWRLGCRTMGDHNWTPLPFLRWTPVELGCVNVCNLKVRFYYSIWNACLMNIPWIRSLVRLLTFL